MEDQLPQHGDWADTWKSFLRISQRKLPDHTIRAYADDAVAVMDDDTNRRVNGTEVIHSALSRTIDDSGSQLRQEGATMGGRQQNHGKVKTRATFHVVGSPDTWWLTCEGLDTGFGRTVKNGGASFQWQWLQARIYTFTYV